MGLIGSAGSVDAVCARFRLVCMVADHNVGRLQLMIGGLQLMHDWSGLSGVLLVAASVAWCPVLLQQHRATAQHVELVLQLPTCNATYACIRHMVFGRCNTEADTSHHALRSMAATCMHATTENPPGLPR